MTSAALSCVPPPVCEPTVQCQSGCVLLSISLKRHLYNREPVWFIHFGFCHVTVWIFNRNGKFLQDCWNTFHAFTLCPNITLNKGGSTVWGYKEFNPFIYITITFVLYHSQDLDPFVLHFWACITASFHQTLSPLLAPDWPDCIRTVESLKMLCGAFWRCWFLHLVLLTKKRCVRPWDLTYISFLINHFHTRLFTDFKFSIVLHPCLLSCALLPCLSWCVAVYLVTCWSVE